MFYTSIYRYIYIYIYIYICVCVCVCVCRSIHVSGLLISLWGLAKSLFVRDKYVTPAGKRLHAGYVQKTEFDTTARSKQDVRMYDSMVTYYIHKITTLTPQFRRLRGLAVACWITDHYHPCSNIGMGISEDCFVFNFASLPLEVARAI